MDTTQKTLSIDIDTSALVDNANKAKSAINDLTNQLNALKTAGTTSGPVFTALSNQLKTTTADFTASTKAMQDYTNALLQKTQAEQADAKVMTDNKATEDPNNHGQPVLTASQPALKVQDSPATPLSDQGVSQTTVDAINKKMDDDQAKDATAALAKKLADRITLTKKYYTDVAALNKTGADSNRQFFNQEIQLLATKDKAYEDSSATVASVFASNTIANKVALDAKKVFGAAEIAMNTEQQISSIILGTEYAVTQDLLVPVIGEVLAAIDYAGGAIKIAGAIADGRSQMMKLSNVTVPNPPSTGSTTAKARGGIFQSDGFGAYLTGPGTGISDSINARLSDGESVINARSTRMFGPILSAINQAGGGVPFEAFSSHSAYAVGGLFNGSNTLNDGSTDLANTRAMNDMVRTIAANMPRQVLVVEDVQASLQNKVMLQNMSNF